MARTPKRVDFDQLLMMTDKEFEFTIGKLIRFLGFSISENIDFGTDEKIYIGQGRKSPYQGKYVLRHKKGGLDDLMGPEMLKSTLHWSQREGTQRILLISNVHFSDELKAQTENTDVSLLGPEELVASINEMYEEEANRTSEQSKKKRKRPKVPYGRTILHKLESEYSIDLAPVGVKDWLNTWTGLKPEIESIFSSVVKIDPEDMSRNDTDMLKGLTTRLEGIYFETMKYKVPDAAAASRDTCKRMVEYLLLLVTGTLYEEPLDDLASYRDNFVRFDNEMTSCNKELLDYIAEKEQESQKREKFRNMVLLLYVSGILILMSVLVMKV